MDEASLANFNSGESGMESILSAAVHKFTLLLIEHTTQFMKLNGMKHIWGQDVSTRGSL